MSDGLSTLPNTFQRLMLQWERLAPYNAGQYATLALDLDLASVQAAWRDASLKLGLQQVGQDPGARVTEVLDTIESFVSSSLNQPYTTSESPLRPFMQRRGGQTHVGIIYRHVVADSASIRLVIRAWIERLLHRPIGAPVDRAIGLLRGGGFTLFDSTRPWNLARETIAEFTRLSRAKRMRRLPASASVRAPVKWRRVELPDGIVDPLLSYARRHGARLNDIFVAASALACDALMPHEEVESRRDLGIGTIADVRPGDCNPRDQFGLLLGFIQTAWRPRDLLDWPRTLAVTAAQARVARVRALAQASVLRLWAAEWFSRDFDLEKLATFYRKRCPLAAGISNVNLNNDWPAKLHPSPLVAYTRVSPLGPMLPLVFTPTTLGKTLHLGVTWRTSVLDDERASAIIEAFTSRLQSLVSK